MTTIEDAERPDSRAPVRAPARGATKVPTKRLVNIALRTLHIAATGALFGGHVFAVGLEKTSGWFYTSILSGIALVTIEAWPRLLWFYQLRGFVTMAKLLLLGSIPLFWEHRVTILVVIIILASVGSHMPARFRYYSLIHRRVI